MTESPLTSNFQSRAASILGWQPRAWRAVRGGYSAAQRFIVSDDTRSAFVKVGPKPLSAMLLRHESGVYERLSAPFMPRLFGWDDDGDKPILVIEDLSSALWPPPWTAALVDVVLEQIRAMHGCRADLERRTLLHGGRKPGWPAVEADPEPFLSLGLVSPQWLERHLPALAAAEAACVLEGDAVCHLDLRSDNLCITPEGVKIIDWAEAGLSNPNVDIAGWLPSLRFEGGPMPESILPDAPELAALIAGFFAARAGLPIIPDAPQVRRVQREQLAEALPWAQRALGLAPM